ncbi:putative zinc-binding metallopeptidase [Beijerinckia sp. L45]|uniref:zinc-binding metallopeptidase family protein n=1 Tax=Beijerinckia sp. L45 TaxID=1641855 RepID=UPI00131C1984|nr:putative zinc-binding peptidase [Beijerinckia sp. L45]
MKLFSCQSCSQILFFENTRCERCQHALGYWPDDNVLSALEPDGDAWIALGVNNNRFRLCANAAHDVCNWLVPTDSTTGMCAACSHNRVIPELNSPDHRLAWRKIEVAKHRLFYTLFRLNLAQTQNMLFAAEPLVFKFMDDVPNAQHKVMTGHEDGVITIALSEADDAEREQRRKAMGEPYRTLLGHFRHEVGHYFWDRLVRDGNKLNECRAIFGDDTLDYQEALKTHYAKGPPLDWQTHFVSAYATCHPWEDFAETWAHYLHIIDTLEMARAFNLQLSPAIDKDGEFSVDQSVDPYAAPTMQPLIDNWLPVTTALNTMSKTMGKEDLYPFVLSPAVVQKLDFIHTLVHSSADRMPEPALAS